MRYQFVKLFVAGGLWLGLLAHHGQAQFQMPHGPSGPATYEQDVDAFAPAEMDIDGMTIGREDRGGYLFKYDFTYMNIGGERTTVGDKQTTRELPPVWMDRFTGLNTISLNPFFLDSRTDPLTGRAINPDNGQIIQRPFLINTIQETKPDASFRTANRIDFGFTNEGNGWMVSILHGPKQQQSRGYGTNGGAQEGQGFNAVTFPNGAMSPIGDVYIAFKYQNGLMHGFQDLVVGGGGTGRVLPADTDGDGILDGDGFADDIDSDGQYGPDGFDVNLPAGIPDTFFILAPSTVVQPEIDYGDLVELPTAFRAVLVRNASTINGIELMGTYRLNNRHFMAKNQNNYFDVYYGVRYYRFRDNFVVNTEGGVLGQCVWDTQIINNIIGPQLGICWTSERGRWRSDLSGRFTAGYNLSNWRQDGFIGEDLTPGRLNHPIYLRAHSFDYARQDNKFSPIAEMRYGVAYQVTKQIAVNAGWTGTYVGSIFRASTHVNYELPNMGFNLNGIEHYVSNGGNFGIEYNY